MSEYQSKLIKKLKRRVKELETIIDIERKANNKEVLSLVRKLDAKDK